METEKERLKGYQRMYSCMSYIAGHGTVRGNYVWGKWFIEVYPEILTIWFKLPCMLCLCLKLIEIAVIAPNISLLIPNEDAANLVM